jgi:hypothetical protein
MAQYSSIVLLMRIIFRSFAKFLDSADIIYSVKAVAVKDAVRHFEDV